MSHESILSKKQLNKSLTRKIHNGKKFVVDQEYTDAVMKNADLDLSVVYAKEAAPEEPKGFFSRLFNHLYDW
jgi:hypothetical protein